MGMWLTAVMGSSGLYIVYLSVRKIIQPRGQFLIALSRRDGTRTCMQIAFRYKNSCLFTFLLHRFHALLAQMSKAVVELIIVFIVCLSDCCVTNRNCWTQRLG